MKKYIVVKSIRGDYYGFIDSVNEEIDNGYKPIGGICTDGHYPTDNFHQSMILDKKD